MNRKYWRAMGMSHEQHQRWRIETIIKTYFDYIAEADEWGVDDNTIIEMIAEQDPKTSEVLIREIIDSFKTWQQGTFEEIYDYDNHGGEIDSIVNYIMDNPRRYFESPSGDITNLIGKDKESIADSIKNYITTPSN